MLLSGFCIRRSATRLSYFASVMMVLVIGGGSFALLDSQPAAPTAQTSATVRDLQSFDGNAQLFQQLNTLDGDEDSGPGASN